MDVRIFQKVSAASPNRMGTLSAACRKSTPLFINSMSLCLLGRQEDTDNRWKLPLLDPVSSDPGLLRVPLQRHQQWLYGGAHSSSSSSLSSYQGLHLPLQTQVLTFLLHQFTDAVSLPKPWPYSPDDCVPFLSSAPGAGPRVQYNGYAGTRTAMGRPPLKPHITTTNLKPTEAKAVRWHDSEHGVHRGVAHCERPPHAIPPATDGRDTGATNHSPSGPALPGHHRVCGPRQTLVPGGPTAALLRPRARRSAARDAALPAALPAWCGPSCLSVQPPRAGLPGLHVVAHRSVGSFFFSWEIPMNILEKEEKKQKPSWRIPFRGRTYLQTLCFVLPETGKLRGPRSSPRDAPQEPSANFPVSCSLINFDAQFFAPSHVMND